LFGFLKLDSNDTLRGSLQLTSIEQVCFTSYEIQAEDISFCNHRAHCCNTRFVNHFSDLVRRIWCRTL